MEAAAARAAGIGGGCRVARRPFCGARPSSGGNAGVMQGGHGRLLGGEHPTLAAAVSTAWGRVHHNVCRGDQCARGE
eukprot:995565-Prymnesium_polylepis.1